MESAVGVETNVRTAEWDTLVVRVVTREHEVQLCANAVVEVVLVMWGTGENMKLRPLCVCSGLEHYSVAKAIGVRSSSASD